MQLEGGQRRREGEVREVVNVEEVMKEEIGQLLEAQIVGLNVFCHANKNGTYQYKIALEFSNNVEKYVNHIGDVILYYFSIISVYHQK